MKKIEKSYTEGVYSDTPSNKKLGRVGMSYSSYNAKTNKEINNDEIHKFLINLDWGEDLSETGIAEINEVKIGDKTIRRVGNKDKKYFIKGKNKNKEISKENLKNIVKEFLSLNKIKALNKEEKKISKLVLSMSSLKDMSSENVDKIINYINQEENLINLPSNATDEQKKLAIINIYKKDASEGATTSKEIANNIDEILEELWADYTEEKEEPTKISKLEDENYKLLQRKENLMAPFLDYNTYFSTPGREETKESLDTFFKKQEKAFKAAASKEELQEFRNIESKIKENEAEIQKEKQRLEEIKIPKTKEEKKERIKKLQALNFMTNNAFSNQKDELSSPEQANAKKNLIKAYENEIEVIKNSDYLTEDAAKNMISQAKKETKKAEKEFKEKFGSSVEENYNKKSDKEKQTNYAIHEVKTIFDNAVNAEGIINETKGTKKINNFKIDYDFDLKEKELYIKITNKEGKVISNKSFLYNQKYLTDVKDSKDAVNKAMKLINNVIKG